MSTQMVMQSNQSQVLLVDLAAQYRTIAPEINEAIAKVIQSTDFILGREVGLFEEEFAAYCEAKYAVGVDSGTSALELALRAYDIGPGDEVITAANSFIASALAISHACATPVLVDDPPMGVVLASSTRSVIRRLNSGVSVRTSTAPTHTRRLGNGLPL